MGCVMEERGSPAPGTRGLVESVLGPQPTDLQALLDSVPAYIWYKDQNNRLLRLNRLAADSMGMRVEAAIMPVLRPKVNIGKYSKGGIRDRRRDSFRTCSTQTQLGGTH